MTSEDRNAYALRLSALRIFFITIAILCAAMMMPSYANAETATVSTLAAFKTALANDDVDTIIVTKAIALGSETYDGKGKTVQVTTPYLDADGAIQSGYSAYQMFTVASGVEATLKDMTIMGGYIDGDYAAIAVTSGSLHLDGVEITRSGRGIYNNGGYVDMVDCNLVRNASKYGGGFLSKNSAVTVMDRCSFSENRTTGTWGGGGCEINSSSVLYANNTVISNNSTYECGGAMNVLNKAKVYLSNCTITGNITTSSSNANGGGIGGHSTSYVYAVNCLFTSNYYNNAKSSSYRSDVGLSSANDHAYFYYCIYGALSGNTTNRKLTECRVDTGLDDSSTFRLYSEGTLPLQESSRTNAFHHPQLVTAHESPRADYFYSPLNDETDEGGNLVSCAATGGVKTYFTYGSKSTVAMSYDVNGTNTKLGDASLSTDVVDDCYETGYTHEKRSTYNYSFVGASTIATCPEYFTLTLLERPASTVGEIKNLDKYGRTYQRNTQVTMEAEVTNDSYAFIGWYQLNDDGTTYTLISRDTSAKVTMTKDISVRPVFSEKVKISDSSVTAEIGDYDYTGEEIEGIPTLKWEDSVTGETVTLTEGTDYEITSYSNNINAGENTATVTVTGKGIFTGTRDIKFTINKIDQTVTVTLDGFDDDGNILFTITTTDTDTDELEFSASMAEGEDIASVTTEGATVKLTPKATGNVKFEVTSKETTNYKEGTTSYSVSVGTLVIAAIAEDETLTYNGEAQEAGTVQILKKSDEVTYELSYSTDNATWQKDMLTYTEAGEYKTYFKVDAKGYEYYEDETTGKEEKREITDTLDDSWKTTINPAANSWTTELSIEGWTYGDEANSPSAEAKYETEGEPVYKYSTSKDGEYTTDVPTDAGTYYVKAYVEAKKSSLSGYTDWNDYDALESDPVKFTIEPKKVEIPEGLTLKYNGKEQTGVIIEESDSYQYVSGNIKATNIGTYAPWIELKDTRNYVWSDGTLAQRIVKWSIVQGTVDIPGANTGLVYTGEEQTGVKATEGCTVDGGTATNAGSYTATAKLEDSTNYTWSDGTTGDKAIEWSIDKATPTVTINYDSINEETNAMTFTSETTNTDSGIEWSASIVEAEDQDGNKGEATLSHEGSGTVTLTPVKSGHVTFTVSTSETDNYYAASATKNVRLSTLVILANAESVELTYTGEAQDAGEVNVVKPKDKSLYTLKYSTDGENWKDDVPTYTEAGEYTTYYKIHAEQENEEGELDTDEFTGSWTTTIKTATNSWTTIPGIKSWTYGDTAEAPEGESKFGDVTFMYSTSSDGEYTTEKPNTAGTYYMKAVVAAKTSGHDSSVEDYTALESTPVSFTISRKQVEIPTAATGLVYSGEEQTGVVSADENLYTVENGTATKAGDYEAVARLVDSDNYEWTDGSHTAQTISWSIAKADQDDPTVSNDDLTYDGNAQALGSVTVGEGGTTVTYSLSEDGDYSSDVPTKKDAGTYTVYYKIAGDENHNDYTGSYEVKISKTNQSEPTVSNDNLTYNGKNQELGSVTAGDGGTTVTYSLSEDGDYSSSVPTKKDAGTYTVYYKVAGDDNHTEYTGSYTVTIDKADAVVTLDKTAGTSKYPKGVTFNATTTNDDEDCKMTASSSDESIATVSIDDDGKVTVTAKKTGTTTITVTSPATGNYNEASTSYTVTVSKGSTDDGTMVVTVPEAKNVTYNGGEQSPDAVVATAEESKAVVTYSTSEDGDYSESVPSFTDAGTYTIYYKVTADNYEDVTGSYTFTIDKKQIEAPTAQTGLTYNGDEQTGVEDADEKVGKGGLFSDLVYTVEDGKKTDAGDYTATVTLTDPDNYEWSDGTTDAKTLDWSIASKTIDDDYEGLAIEEVEDQKWEADHIDESTGEWVGEEKRPKPTVRDKDTGEILTEGEDYELVYEDNEEEGTATLTINFIGNYSGSRSLDFKIVREVYTLYFYPHGGDWNGSTEPLTIDYKDHKIISIPEAPTRDGYTFVEWRGSSYQPGDEYTVVEDHKFTAIWEKDEEIKTSENGTTGSGSDNGSDADSSDGVKTGDSNQVWLIAIILVLAAAEFIILAVKRRREDD